MLFIERRGGAAPLMTKVTSLRRTIVMKHKGFIFLCFLLVVTVIAVIWWHSMQNGVSSHAESRRVLAWVLARIPGTAVAPYLSDGVIRRLAHLTEYTTLGVVLSSFSVLISRHSHKVWVLLIGIGVAAIDEYIQLFSGGRTSTWHDVVLDGVGCMIGIVLVMVIRGVKRGIGAIHK